MMVHFFFLVEGRGREVKLSLGPADAAAPGVNSIEPALSIRLISVVARSCKAICENKGLLDG